MLPAVSEGVVPQRCSFCGSWQDRAARKCSACGERLHGPTGYVKRVVRLALILTGAILIGATLQDVIQPVVDSRNAVGQDAALLFLAGVVAVAIGFIWR